MKRPDECNKASTQLYEDFSAWVRQLETRCWEAVLRNIRELEREGLPLGGMLLRPRLLLIIGDHPQLQSRCGISSSGKAAVPCRVRKVPTAKLGEFYSLRVQMDESVCQLRSAAATTGLIRDLAAKWDKDDRNLHLRKAAKRVSIVMPPQLPAFLNDSQELAQFSHAYGGVHAHSPQDRLHHGELAQ